MVPSLGRASRPGSILCSTHCSWDGLWVLRGPDQDEALSENEGEWNKGLKKIAKLFPKNLGTTENHMVHHFTLECTILYWRWNSTGREIYISFTCQLYSSPKRNRIQDVKRINKSVKSFVDHEHVSASTERIVLHDSKFKPTIREKSKLYFCFLIICVKPVAHLNSDFNINHI